MQKSNKTYLIEVSRQLRATKRLGLDKDEPEDRYIRISDICANEIADNLGRIAEEIDE